MEMDIQQIMERFTILLQGKGMRKSQERYAVLQAIYTSSEMLSAKDILEYLSKRRFRISRSSLYNILSLLLEWRFVEKMVLCNGTVLYGKLEERRQTVAFQCTKCGKLTSIDSEDWSRFIVNCCDKYGFELENQKLLLQGLCLKCKKH